MTPYIVEKGMAHCIALYARERSQSHHGPLPNSPSHRGILPKSQGYIGFSSKVAQSEPNFRLSQFVTLVTAVGIAHIGVTTP